MKVGDLVRCKDDPETTFGVGLVIGESYRLVRVLWSEPPPYSGQGENEWLWKNNLEVINEAR